MAYKEITYEVSERIATVTLNRPDKLNAWTMTMEAEVKAAMTEADADDEIRIIVLTGAGRGFCAGADISGLGNLATEGKDIVEKIRALYAEKALAKDRVSENYNRKYTYFPAIDKPIIAAINGPAVGLGFILPLYCDLRFASDRAVFSTAFSKRGLVAEHGIAWLLPRLVGMAVTLDLLYSARKLDVQEALRCGLLNRVVPHDQLMEEVRSYARDLTQTVSPRSLRVMKRQVYEAQLQTLNEAVDRANEEMFESFGCEDFREGVAHFVEKRPPAFVGR